MTVVLIIGEVMRDGVAAEAEEAVDSEEDTTMASAVARPVEAVVDP